MVTFVCYYCDQTLKKKQIERHFSCPKPFKFICIDCHQTFVGQEHKAHTNCISEQDKFWGQYAQSKPNKKVKPNENQQPQQQQQPVTTTNIAQQAQKVNKKVEENKISEGVKIQQKEVEQEEQEQNENSWKGWKKTIKFYLKQKTNKCMKLSKLKQKVIDEYIQSFPDSTKEQAEQLFDKKIKTAKVEQYNEPYLKIANKQ